MSFHKTRKENSFAQWFIDNWGIEKFNILINHKKNIELGLDIWSISKRSEVNIWFYCENKSYHEFCISADKYNIGYRCKYCARTKYVHPKDSLGQYILDIYGEDFLSKVWSDKNTKSSFKFSLGTDKKVWFKCINKIHEDKLRLIKNTVRSNFNCPYCVENGNSSKLQEKVYKYIDSLEYKINTEHKCTIVPINPKTKLKLPFDNEIEELKLIIEVNGRQHYKEISGNSKWLNGVTATEYLYSRRLKDRYKKIIAIVNGYNYLEIPYSSDDDQESWKHLINNKINNIKEGTTTETNRLHF